jgi:hypothetical protein
MSESPNTNILMSKYQAHLTIEVHSLLDVARWFDEIHITEQQEISMEHYWTDDSWEGLNYLEKYLPSATMFTTNLTQTAFVLNLHPQ